MEPKVYIDGELYPKSEAKISVFDHGLLYGDGVFEGIRIYSGRIFRFKAHIDRLYDSAKSIGLAIPLSRSRMDEAVVDTVRANGFRDAYIRLVVTRGVGDLGLDPKKCKIGSVIIIVDKIQLYPEELYRQGIKVITAATRRVSPDMFSPMAKSLNYLNNILAKMEANQAGCPESLMLNAQGLVAECTADNIFLVKHGELLTPAPEHAILLGVTRAVAMELARSLGINVRELPVTRHDVYLADECFLTGTGAELVPVVALDERLIGNGKPGPLTGKLRKEFSKLRETEGEDLFAG
ncbi:MAG: branched-chain-amino-acid transaminase [Candidatus Glassbacteria bacterium]|nr:branched-chain-amino-acid transaminase [Candidatus Glassbacteria bacterium]